MGNKVSKNKPSIDLNADKIASPSPVKHFGSPSESFSTITTRLSSNASKLTPIPETPHHIIFHSSFPSTLPVHVIKSQQKRDSSSIQINNGVTGTFISYKITRLAAKFWQQNINDLPINQRLEIGCALFFGALSSNKKMTEIMRLQLRERTKTIEQTALKYLEMIEWLVRCLMKDNIELYSLLVKLGAFHKKMGIKISHFGALLESMHETFSYYFPKKYNIEVIYAMDEIFIVSAQIMSGQDIKCSSHLNSITKSFQKEESVDFIKSLSICLKSTIGCQYMYRYLQQTFCDEIAIFLQLVTKFKGQLSDVQRFMVARDVVRTSIAPSANLTINISYNCRKNILIAIDELERQFKSKEPFHINTNFFDEAEREMYKLILENHWTTFCKSIKNLHSKSLKL